MKAVTLELTLQTDAVFTATGATVGQARSLDYVPGATLLGAAARVLYDAMGADALRAFHLGDVRFGDGRPVHPTLGAPGFPTPLSWHQPKTGDGVLDFSQVDRPSGQQWSQCRGSWRAVHDGRWVEFAPEQDATMRTAMTEGGTAREGLLYGFIGVRAGTRFRATLRGADALVDPIVTALTGGTLRLGRSRSAEYGEATARMVAPEVGTQGAGTSDRLRFLCASDLALIDGLSGAPRLRPEAGDVGLPPGWTLDDDRSFLRFRRYSPFNGTRRRPDPERQVVAAGSVLTFHRGRGDAANRQRVIEHLAVGVGAYVEAGLGELLLEPLILASANPECVTIERASEVAVSPPSDPLVAWMGARRAAQTREDGVWQAVDRESRKPVYHRVSRSQWGRLRSFASEARHGGKAKEPFLKELDRLLNDGVSADDWKRAGNDLRAFYHEQSARTDHVVALEALELLARRVPRVATNGGAR